MERRTNLKNRFFLFAFMLVAMAMNVMAEKVPYVVFEMDDRGWLIFKYGEMPEGAYAIPEKIEGDDLPPWYEKRDEVYRVAIDTSFVDVRPKSCRRWFYGLNKATAFFTLKYLNTSEVTDMSEMFAFSLFGYAISYADIQSFDTRKVTDMSGMFRYCNCLKSLNVSGFDTGNVTDMSEMFCGCSSLNKLDVSGFNTSNVTDMSYMFHNCENLMTLDVSGFNTTNVTDMSYMFHGCKNLATLDVSGFNTSCVTNMSYMFFNCNNLTNLDVSGFNTSNVTDMRSMFFWCNNLTNLDVSGFNTGNVTDMGYMFCGCQLLTALDLRLFDTSKVTKMESMFFGGGVLETILCNKNWNKEQLSSSEMFKSCKKLKGAINYVDSLSNDAAYANYETGYFTCQADTFALKIVDEPVTDVNSKYLAIIPGVTGTATYNNDTHTLSLTDATISNANGKHGIYCYSTIDTLTINVKGECSIECPGGTGIQSLAKCVKIQGSGTLNISGDNGIYTSRATANTLWVTGGVKVYVDGTTYGMKGGEYLHRNGLINDDLITDYTTTLQVDGKKTLLSVKGTTQCYQNLGSFTLTEGFDVTAPRNAVFFKKDLGGNVQQTFCTPKVIKDKTTGSLITIFIPVAGTAVVIENPRVVPVILKKGDVNGDDAITMADANAVVNYFLTTDKPSDFDVTTADVNGDGEVTMADANQIVNSFLSGVEVQEDAAPGNNHE